MPKQFEEPDVAVIHQLLREWPLATIITGGVNGLDANLVPLSLVVTEEHPLGVLQGHVARANPVWTEYFKDNQVLAVFNGSESYISPSWYATKQETGRVVPTWNYAVVHARGMMRVIEDSEWLRAQVGSLTQAQEANFERPWSISDAPAEYIENLLTAIVGVEITITRLQGKWKVSQNQPEQNVTGVVRGLESLETQKASDMASLVCRYAERREP